MKISDMSTELAPAALGTGWPMALSADYSAFQAVSQQLQHYLAGFGLPDIVLQPYQAAPLEGLPKRPAISAAVLLLPAQYQAIDCGSADGVDCPNNIDAAIYRAAAAHAVAHLRHSRRHHPAAKRKPMLLAILALIEDARVERLMVAQYPGLHALWGRFHVASGDAGELSLASLTARLARALHDPAYVDQNHWVNKGRDLFQRACLSSMASLEDGARFEEVGQILANDLGQMRVPFDLEQYRVEPAYRDDNTLLWDFGSEAQDTPPEEMLARAAAQNESESGNTEDGADHTGLAEAADDVVTELGHELMAELMTELTSEAGAESTVEQNTVMSANAHERVAATVHQYGEWDYRVEIERKNWVTLFETAPAQFEPVFTEHTMSAARHNSRLPPAPALLTLDRAQRLRRQHEGDELDLNAVIESRISMRGKLAPDPRIFQKSGQRQVSHAILLLLDVSQSCNDRIEQSVENSVEAGMTGSVTGSFTQRAITILELEKQAAHLVAQAFEHSQHRIAVHGFASNGRNCVHYSRIKDFEEPFGTRQQQRLARQEAALSTRMGAALRHAGTQLAPQAGDKKILFLITDGAPSDIDVFDSRYLIEDARHAVTALAAQGVMTFCLTLDQRADAYVRAIFGERGYLIVDNAATLPQQLARALAKLFAR